LYKGKLIVISGPSGAGKSTLLKMLLEKYKDKFRFSVSFTSRKPRIGEKDGEDYFFISQEEFEKNIKENIFLEWAVVHGNYYGTSKKYIEDIINSGFICILDIDVQGALNLMNKKIEALYIFISPPSIEILKERLLKRNTDTLETIERRIKNAENEMKYKDYYNHIVINDEIDRAFKELEDIIFGEDNN